MVELNKMHKILYTIETENNNSINFLELKICIKEEHIELGIYCKPHTQI
jgi:hypothetical protein